MVEMASPFSQRHPDLPQPSGNCDEKKAKIQSRPLRFTEQKDGKVLENAMEVLN